ncbi:hypothetical protein [Candidatus Formimonas warabiya]|uniref:Uncharacterized protein n=1 Tax=Formimonas warabiya TaxID=1761012 RepID=A0A3G1KYH8_FORW1|nr:hypothetical protein [Candidatus Formimonas warabiya]ATW27502.1 hypothetical protein DCMF_24565 [Candidatus Formimonas warabiya]
MINSKVLFGWDFSFSGTPDFWNGLSIDDYSLRYVDKMNQVRQMHFKEIFELAEYVRANDIRFGSFKKEIFPPCSIAMKGYTFYYFDNDVLLKARRSLSNSWKSQYHAVDRGKSLIAG